MKTTKQRLQELANVKAKKRSLKEAKSNIKTTWRNMQDLEADMQDWMSTLDAQQVQEVLDTLQNFVDNYEGEMDNDF
jgi:cell shape-determining protein MreC